MPATNCLVVTRIFVARCVHPEEKSIGSLNKEKEDSSCDSCESTDIATIEESTCDPGGHARKTEQNVGVRRT